MSDLILELKELKTQFISKDSTVTPVDGVSYNIKKGEILGLVGESGCGKSVTALSIMRLFRDTTGKITGGSVQFNGKDLVKVSEKEMAMIRGKDIAMIFKEPLTSLNPVAKIGKQIIEVILKHEPVSVRQARETAVKMLELVGIPRAEQVMNEYPHQLSGGMNQRVMIAMGMSLNPQVLIADEPTTALDVTIQAQILELMKRINEEHGMSILLITHDLGVVAEMCSRVVVMYAGRIVEEADAENLFLRPRHPYTIGLINSIPVIGKNVERLESIPGNVPSLTNMPLGCKFAPRCSKALERCKAEEPGLFTVVSDGMERKCRCWLAAEPDKEASYA
ncbi:MAG: ABC transporter ATP-binding protein [Clostridiales bacterium]|jgi:peptide/nickel transport system ATP-binding protein|nr:ABC transporter ATP-binding protein [Clostridiales bacterium]